MPLIRQAVWVGWVVSVLALVSLSAAGGNTPLLQAARSGATSEIRTLLERHADVNVAEVDGTTALHWAVNRNDVEAVKLLLRAGANAKAANRYHVTPLSLACENGSAETIELLLKAGADPNTALRGGETALMTAARVGKVDALKVLLAAGANVDATDTAHGQNALMWAAAQGRTEAVGVLIEAGADVHARSRDVYYERPRRGAGAEPTAVNIALTPLLFAVREGHIDTVRTLLERGAKVSDTLADGTGAVVLAAMSAQWEMGAFLLDHGADPNAAGQGWAALHETAKVRQPSVGQIPFPEPMGRLSGLDLAKKLIEKGADVNLPMWEDWRTGVRTDFDRVGATPFAVAAKGVDVDLMRLLLAHGAEFYSPTEDGTTPLMVAAGIGMALAGEDSGTHEDALAAVKMLVELGADVNQANYAGETPLHGAAYRGAPTVVQYLVEKGAKIDAREARGLNPYDYAAGQSRSSDIRPQPATMIQIAQLMKERGLAVVLTCRWPPCIPDPGVTVQPAPVLGNR